MIRYDNTIAIARPPAEVFDLIMDVPRAYEWTDMTDGRWISDPPIEVGARAEAKLSLGPVRPVIRWDVTRLERPRVVSFRTELARLKGLLEGSASATVAGYEVGS